MKTYFPLISLVVILFCSCSSSKTAISQYGPKYETKLDSLWIGKSKHDVCMNFGIPNRIIDDGEFGEIIAYDKTDSHKRTETVTTTAINNQDFTKNKRTETDYPIIYTTLNSTQFFINKSGNVYKCKYFEY